MRISVPHFTTKEVARQKINERIASMFGQYGHYLAESSHSWEGDRLVFSGSAKGFKVSGTMEVTDSDVVIDAKLPLIAKPFESRVKHTVETEAVSMFGKG
jgi:hypothetical protein